MQAWRDFEMFFENGLTSYLPPETIYVSDEYFHGGADNLMDEPNKNNSFAGMVSPWYNHGVDMISPWYNHGVSQLTARLHNEVVANSNCQCFTLSSSPSVLAAAYQNEQLGDLDLDLIMAHSITKTDFSSRMKSVVDNHHCRDNVVVVGDVML
jgi:hypothetical protein